MKKLKTNVGPLDRLIRISLGLIIAILGIVFNSWWGLVGVLLIATGLFKFCLLYLPFGINTAKKKE